MAYKFPVQSEVEIQISTIGSDLKIEGHSQDEIRANGDEPLIKVTDEKRHVEIECTGDCDLKVPESARVTIDVIGAEAKIKRLRQQVTVNQIGADLSAQDLGGLHVDAVGSDVDVKRIEGDVHIGTIGADAEFSDIQADLHVDSIGADVSLEDIGGNCSITSIGGDLVLFTEFGTDYHFGSVGGDVIVKLQSDEGVSFMIPSHAARSIHLPGVRVEENDDTTTITWGEPKANVTIDQIGGDFILVGDGHDEEEVDMEDLIPDNLEEIITARINDQMAHVRRASEKAIRETEHARKRAIREAEHERERAKRDAQRAMQDAQRAMQDAQRAVRHHGRDWHVEFSWPGGPKEKRKNGQPYPPVPPVPPMPPMAGFGKRKRVHIEVNPESEPVSDEERLTILRMVENKQITVEEAERLLSALEGR